MYKYTIAFLMIAIDPLGCSPIEKEAHEVFTPDEELKLKAHLTCRAEGGAVYGTLAVTNERDKAVRLPKYVFVQRHDDDTQGFQVRKDGEYAKYTATQEGGPDRSRIAPRGVQHRGLHEVRQLLPDVAPCAWRGRHHKDRRTFGEGKG